MSKYDDLVGKALLLWLIEARGVTADSAEFDETNIPQGGGCDTCGYGGDNDLSFDIRYTTDTGTSYATVDGDPLSFFATLFPYMERVDTGE